MTNLNTFSPDWVSPPGETIQRLMRKVGYSHRELANELDIPTEMLGKIISGDEAITKSIAYQLSRILGSTPTFWLTREKQYRDEITRLKNHRPRPKSAEEEEGFEWFYRADVLSTRGSQ